jgi:prophage DNA circulation protein
MSQIQIYTEAQYELVRMKTRAIQWMTEQGEHLARTFTTNCCDGNNWYVSMPTIVVAYRYYGVLADASINARNEVPNPLFIPSNASLELLAELTEAA